MQCYLFVATQAAYSDNTAEDYLNHINELLHRGNQVSVFLIQNGVLSARQDSSHPVFDKLMKNPITIYADEHSLHHHHHILASALNTIIQAALNGDEVIWA